MERIQRLIGITVLHLDINQLLMVVKMKSLKSQDESKMNGGVLMILDDPIEANFIRTAEQKKAALEWFRETGSKLKK
jgi:hypothetical protein